MSDNNLVNRQGGQLIKATDVNQFHESQRGDIVPRNLNGIPTDIFAGLGSSIYKWAKGYFTQIKPGEIATNLEINESGTDLRFQIGSLVSFFVDTGITVSDLKNSSVRVDAFSVVTEASSNVNSSVNSTSWVDVVEDTITIAENRPILICLDKGAASTSGVGGSEASASSLTIVYFRLLKNGTQIAGGNFRLTGSAVSGDTHIIRVPSACYKFLDSSPGVGTHTYKIQAQSSATTQTIIFDNQRLFLIQI